MERLFSLNWIWMYVPRWIHFASWTFVSFVCKKVWMCWEELKVFTTLSSWFNSNLLLSRSIHKHSFLWFPFPSILQSTLHISLFRKWSLNKIARCPCWAKQKKNLEDFRFVLFLTEGYQEHLLRILQVLQFCFRLSDQ